MFRLVTASFATMLAMTSVAPAQPPTLDDETICRYRCADAVAACKRLIQSTDNVLRRYRGILNRDPLNTEAIYEVKSATRLLADARNILKSIESSAPLRAT